LIPILLLIFIIISIFIGGIKFRKVIHFDKYTNKFIESRTIFYEDKNQLDNYEYIKNFLPSISFVVDNEIEKNELKNFIEKETGVKSITYYTISEKKNNISDYYTIIMTQKNGKYKITVKSTYFYDIIDLNYETQEKTIDLFNSDTMWTSYYRRHYDGDYGFSGYNQFLDLQSLLAKYLILFFQELFPLSFQ
jgi:hypothetical protein